MVGNIKNMHYDFKQKLNKIDSNAYIGLQIPEIDRILNRALNLYILLIAKPRLKNTSLGFEKIQRTTDDIRPLVIDGKVIASKFTNPPELLGKGTLPDDYLYYLSGSFAAERNGHTKELEMKVVRHNNRNRNTAFHDGGFYGSDFDWGVVNIRFNNKGIQAELKDFELVVMSIDYIKKHPYMHFAEGFSANGYNLPNGELLEGFQDCILEEITHDEITDLAVLLATNDLVIQDNYQMKKDVSIMKQLINN